MNATFVKDAAERVVTSFLEAVLAVVVSGGVSALNASTVHVLLIAGLTAAFATAKTLLAGTIPSTLTPASLAGQARSKARDAGLTLVELLLAFCVVVCIVLVVLWLAPHH